MILVTAPTGQIGAQVLAGLSEQGLPTRVIARSPERLQRLTLPHIDIVAGSHGDPKALSRALDDVDTVFWLVPPDPHSANIEEEYVAFTRPALDVMRAKGVRRIVGVSALGRGAPQAAHAGLVTGSLAMDDLIAASGIAYRAITSPSFFDNLLRQTELIRTRRMFFSAVDPTRQLPACATRDIAAVSVHLLARDDWTGFAEAPVLGPEDLSFNDMAEIMSEVLGESIRCQRIDYESYREQFVARGASPAFAKGMADMARAKSEGLDNLTPRTLATSSPTNFRQWCADALAASTQ